MIRTPSELPRMASGGSCEYDCVPLLLPLLEEKIWAIKIKNGPIREQLAEAESYRTKKSFSLMPETQATALSDSMVAPNHTCTGLTTLRREAGLQGRRKVATPTAHCKHTHT